jgi:hypothetical protein
MKRIASAVICFALIFAAGCTDNANTLSQSVQASLSHVLSQTAAKANHSKEYYSYYIEPSVGRYSSTKTGNIFSYQGTKFAMNLNVAEIINAKYYPEQSLESSSAAKDAVIELEGTYMDTEQIQRTYHVCMYQDGTRMLILMNTDTVSFCGISEQAQAASLAGEMLKIARSVETDEEEIALAYTNHKTLDYKTEKIQLFNEVVPESGTISDLINETNTIGNQDSGADKITSDNQE